MSEEHPYRRVAAGAAEGHRSVVSVEKAAFGNGRFGVIAGAPSGTPFADAVSLARRLAAAGVAMLHDGSSSQARPESRRTAKRLELARAMREETGLPVAVALTDQGELEAVAGVADVIHVAGYHMQNYTLLSELGGVGKPVLLRRGSASFLTELLMAAEYIVHGGNESVLLCERGIRTFEQAYDVTVDFAAIPVLRERTHLPVLVDPSEHRDPRVVAALALAAAAAGADGVILETSHEDAELVERIGRAATLMG
jgi:3-deoxy-7-phosphoheptulonate synthase